MIAERELVLERPMPQRASEPLRRIPQPTQQLATAPSKPSLAWRILLVVIGFNLAVLGWSLVMTVLLAFIGLPVFIFGLALMQAQET